MNINYIAGFFDGEGCASISYIDQKNSPRFKAEINIRNTNKSILLKIEQFLKNMKINSKIFSHKKEKRHHKMGYALRIIDLKQIYNFILLFKNKVKIKKEQLNLLKIYVKSRIQKLKLKNPQNIGLYGYTEQDIKIYKKLKKLNKRGI